MKTCRNVLKTSVYEPITRKGNPGSVTQYRRNGWSLCFRGILFFAVCNPVLNQAIAETNSAADRSNGSPKGDGAQSPRAFSSFMDFSPKAAQYQSELAPFFDLAENILTPKSKPSYTGEAAPQDVSPDEKETLKFALAKANELLAKLPRGLHDELYFLSGFALERSGDLEGALLAYQKSLALKSGNPLVRFRHAVTLKGLHKYAAAQVEFGEVRWQTPSQDYELLYLEGECATALSKADNALHSYEASYLRNPTFLPTLRRLAPLYEAQIASGATTKLKAAAKVKYLTLLNIIVDQDQKDLENGIKFAQILIEQSDPQEREAQLKHGFKVSERISIATKYKDLRAAKLLAQSQRLLGDLEGATQSLKLALQANPKSAEISQMIAQIEAQKQLVAAMPTITPSPVQ